MLKVLTSIVLVLASLVWSVEAQPRKKSTRQTSVVNSIRLMMLDGPNDTGGFGYFVIEVNSSGELRSYSSAAEFIMIGSKVYVRPYADEAESSEQFPRLNQCYQDLYECGPGIQSCLSSWATCLDAFGPTDSLYDDWFLTSRDEMLARGRASRAGKMLEASMPYSSFQRLRRLTGVQLLQFRPLDGKRFAEMIDGQKMIILELSSKRDQVRLFRILPRDIFTQPGDPNSDTRLRIWLRAKDGAPYKFQIDDQVGTPAGYLFIQHFPKKFEIKAPVSASKARL